MIAGALVLVCACSTTSSLLAGDPDPGHRSLAALESALSVVPPGAAVMYEHRVDSHWDSCDGRSSTYGWDPISVDAAFSTDETSQQVIARARAEMGRMGWKYAAGMSPVGTWVWSRQVQGRIATATLQPGETTDSPGWSLEATTPPATHPVTGC